MYSKSFPNEMSFIANRLVLASPLNCNGPLMVQVCNEVGGVQSYQQRVEQHLVPCLAQFAVAAGKDDLWKKLNYQLLLKSRDSNARVCEGGREREEGWNRGITFEVTCKTHHFWPPY